MNRYGLCLLWYWEYDADFAEAIHSACAGQVVSLWQVTPDSLPQAVAGLMTGQTGFAVLLDRGQYHAGFLPILEAAKRLGAYRINPRELSSWSEDKATMHLELINSGIETPYTIILAPFVEQPLLPTLDLSPLGSQFVIKPAVGGGGEGVTMEATSLEQILRARVEYAEQKYLVQAHIWPRDLGGCPAWFRIFYVDGRIHPCWWDPATHIYRPLTTEEEQRFALAPLRQLTARIAAICRLDWFSTELALAEDGKFVAIDYVNDSIDLRPQSKAQDGVPDRIIHEIAHDLVALAARKRQG